MHMPVPLHNEPEVASQVGESKLTYKNTILGLFQKRCSNCHNSASSVPNWTSYEIAYSKRDLIYKRAVIDRTMPPKSIPQAERDLIAKWIEDGAPLGDSSSGPVVINPPASPSPSPVTSPSPTPSEDAPLTYTNHMKSVFQNRCGMCHNSSWPARDWQVYDNVFTYKELIMKRAVLDRTMPPGNITGMTDLERAELDSWINDGAPL